MWMMRTEPKLSARTVSTFIFEKKRLEGESWKGSIEVEEKRRCRSGTWKAEEDCYEFEISVSYTVRLV